MADLYLEVFSGLDPAGEPQLATFPHPGGIQMITQFASNQFHVRGQRIQ